MQWAAWRCRSIRTIGRLTGPTPFTWHTRLTWRNHRSPAGAAWERLGLKTIAFRNKINRTRGFLGVCDTHAVLAFRGTDPVTLPSWVTDAVVKLVECKEYEGRVHRGFSSVLRRTWGKVEKIVKEVQDRPLFLTGHSMGGALAVLTGYRLAKLGCPPAATYTFGSPRVGDPVFCAGVQAADLSRGEPAGPGAGDAAGVGEAAAAGKTAVDQ